MRASFIHLADTHLGYEQYGIRERFVDFTRAFWEVMDEAVTRKVNFVLIAGDLFNKRAIDAMTLIHAMDGLKKLKEHNIPVIAIEGNHDRSYYRDGTSWLQFLCYNGYIQLLSPVIQGGVPRIEPWNPANMLGSHVDVLGGRLRIYGLPWQGAATARTLEGMAQALQDVRTAEEHEGVAYRILMMHTGIDGIVPRVNGLPTMSKFQTLRNSINYLALGHVHKPYDYEGWIYNPGSTETCGAEEVQWEDRGYYYVEVDTDNPEHPHQATRLVTQRRPFVRHDIRVDAIGDPETIYKRLADFCQREGPRYRDGGRPPVVQVHLIGTLAFDAEALDMARMEEMVRTTFAPLYVRVDNNTNDQDYMPDDDGIDGRDRSMWHELERRIFEELVGLDSRYLPASEEWGAVLAELKASALRKENYQQIASYLRDRRQHLLKPDGTPASLS